VPGKRQGEEHTALSYPLSLIPQPSTLNPQPLTLNNARLETAAWRRPCLIRRRQAQTLGEAGPGLLVRVALLHARPASSRPADSAFGRISVA
jgi:hypothetical protein